uniref:Uncharacterized protein n=1 Tax=Arundo donax TaxID=35708 RepID=A0A0A9F9A3_ARUDO
MLASYSSSNFSL